MPKAYFSHGKPNSESIYCILSSYSNETRLPSNGLKFIINNRFIIKRNWWTLSALKITHVTFKNPNVITHLIIFGILEIGFERAFEKISAAPWTIPQRIKVQFAPCHIPLTTKTINVFRYILAFPFRLPPSGIYMYWVKNLVSVICHLFQKS